MIILRTKTFMDRQAATIDSLKEDLRILRELILEKNKFIERQQNEIYEQKQLNKSLTCKLDTMTERLSGMVISYG